MPRVITKAATSFLGLTLVAAPAFAQSADPVAEDKRRVIILTDIGNEPDDSESFVRFLLYSNQFDVEGLVATTSTWQRDRVQPQLLRERIDAYAKVLPNLRQHAEGYPDAEKLASAVRSGSSAYGMRGVGEGKDTEGSRRIIEVADKPDARPVYIPVWGGAVDLAQALWTVRATRSSADLKRFVSKLRVYSISDQDDAGPWIRLNFPDLFWIASIHGWSQYGNATWLGISGDVRRPDKWPNVEMVTNEWLSSHIRQGPLGSLYPEHMFIMEGDTPSFLGLIDNGLNDPDHPDFGSWGGRYTQAYEGSALWSDSGDTYVDEDGKRWSGNQATVFRWRKTFQNDFAARISWTLTADRSKANHNPIAVVNGVGGSKALSIATKAGATVRLDAMGTGDPDGDRLSYKWWNYHEPSVAPGQIVPPLALTDAGTISASFVAPEVKTPTRFHVILEVSDSGSPQLTAYRRIIVSVLPAGTADKK